MAVVFQPPNVMNVRQIAMALVATNVGKQFAKAARNGLKFLINRKRSFNVINAMGQSQIYISACLRKQKKYFP